MRLPDKTILGLVATFLMGAAVFACTPGVAEAHRPWNDTGHYHPPRGQEVSVALESQYGGALPTYHHDGSVFVAGQIGERYTIRVTNNTGERVEAVVTVDGRDVVSGQIGNYKTQRGYVIAPFGSVTIDGFRQSLDHVAAFRFTDHGDAYSSRWGTPQHVGVVGVAVFKEHRPRMRDRRPPVPIATRPYYEPYYGDYDAPAGDASKAAPTPRPAEAAPPRAGGASSSSPAYRDDANMEYSRRATQLGTQYGETTHSSVQEVSFERRSKRRPDSLLTIYYDSKENLRARGVPVDPSYWSPPPPHDPRPFPESDGRTNQYAPPPPRRY